MDRPMELEPGPQPEPEHVVAELVDFTALSLQAFARIFNSPDLPILNEKLTAHSLQNQPQAGPHFRRRVNDPPFYCGFGMFEDAYDGDMAHRMQESARRLRRIEVNFNMPTAPPSSFRRPEDYPTLEELRERLLRRLINDSPDL